MIRAAFTVVEVAEMYAISETHVRHLIRTGVLNKVPHMGTSVRISPDELERIFGPLPVVDVVRLAARQEQGAA